MCIGIPAKVIEISGTSGKVDYEGVKREASFLMLPEAKVGDYVILHAGFAIKKLSEVDAKETLRLIQEIVRVEKELDG
ncbi:HypC/HybG/HupF family hydrogenase formation chaperone [bacterium]|nr:HypC/HybG/HupF family hydrogenase formation chaperone [bacterium]